MSSLQSKLNTQIYAEACEWLVHFRAGDADDDPGARRDLDEWLRRSPEHVRAYLEVSTLWEELALHDAGKAIDAEAHIARACADKNVISLEAPVTRRSAAMAIGGVRSSRRWRRALAASVAIATLLAGSVGWLVLRPPTYGTEIGEQRTLMLDDGSSIELNARSRIRVRYSEHERTVDLLKGQALFRVAKDSARPFVVFADDTRVRAVGTQFDVNRMRGATRVTVIEGKVGVNAANAALPVLQSGRGSTADAQSREPLEVLLVAGEQLTVTSKAVAAPKPVNITAATAWTQQRLVFDAAPLSQVAEEFNRYNKRPIVIQDKALESIGVIGVFSFTDPTSLLAFLRSQPEIEVLEKPTEIWITKK